ncbi:hypothetical protein [Actinoallomurus sp. NPDC050550]|uniref:hypothetical protein n=1 Tax=Actinoallomurus sp. NPDC050550 TaxID=3154937 RepID=UPI0033FDAE34
MHLRGFSTSDQVHGRADVWHSSFAFMNSKGDILYMAGGVPFASPQMLPANGSSGPSKVYRWDSDVKVSINPALSFQVTSVRWFSQC